MDRDVEVVDVAVDQQGDVLNTSFDANTTTENIIEVDSTGSVDLNVSSYDSLEGTELLTITKQHREYLERQEQGITVSAGHDARQQQPQNREISDEQRAQLTRELREAARDLAGRDHDKSPNAEVDSEALQARLKSILENAARRGVPLTDETVQSLAADFQASYEERREKLFDDMPWYKRGYYNVSGFLSGCGSAISSAFNYVKDGVVAVSQAAYKFATETDWKEVGSSVASAIGTGLTALKDGAIALTKAETWQAIGGAIESGWDATVTFLTSAETWATAWEGVCAVAQFGYDCAVEVGQLGLEMMNPVNWYNGIATAVSWTGQLLSDPGAAWDSLCEGCQNTWEALSNTRLGGAICATGEFLYGVSESIGLNSLVYGAANLAYAPIEAAANFTIATAKNIYNLGRLAFDPEYGIADFANDVCENYFSVVESYFSRMGEGLQAVKGAVMLVGEFTGITDLCLTVHHGFEFCKAYVNDDKAGMMMHGTMMAMHATCAAMSIGAIAATVATAGTAAGAIGAAAAGRMGLKVAAKKVMTAVAKNFVKETAEAMGKEVVERLGKELTTELMESTAKDIAQEGGKELAERIAKEGAEVLTNNVREVMADVAETATEKMLKDANLVQHVDDVVSEMLEDLSAVSTKELTQRLEKQGVENAAARAKEIKRLIKNGKADHELKEILEEEITNAVCKHLEEHMEVAFKTEFRAMLDGSGREALQEAQEKMLREAGVEAREQLPRRLRKEYDELGERIKHCEELEKAAKEEAERLGKDLDEYIDDVVEEGWQGVREGMRRAVRKLVREGIERAFKRFRAGKVRPVVSSDAKKRTTAVGLKQVQEERSEELVSAEQGEESSKTQTVDENRSEVRQVTVTGPDGSVTTYHYQFDPELNQEILINTTVEHRERKDDGATEYLSSDDPVFGDVEVADVFEPELPPEASVSENPVATAVDESPDAIPFSEFVAAREEQDVQEASRLQAFEERVVNIADGLQAEPGAVDRVDQAMERFQTTDHAALVAKIAEDIKNSGNAA